MADAGDNSWASSWGASLGLSSYGYQPTTQTHQDPSSSSSWFPSQPYHSSYVDSSSYYPHNTGSSSHVTNPVPQPQQQYNDEFLNFPYASSYNDQKPVNDEPYCSPYASSSTYYPHDTGYSSYFTNLQPQQQENDDFLNLSLSSYNQSKGKEAAYQKPVYDGFGATSLNNQALDHVSTELKLGRDSSLDHVSTELKLGRDSWTTMQDSTHERNLRLSSHPWSIRKKLQSSDTDYSGRVWLPVAPMRDHILPSWINGDRLKGGVEVSVWDCDTKSKHQLILKKKESRKEDRYFLTSGWSKDFLKRRGLKEGDEIGLHWDPNDSRFNFCVFD